MITVGLTGGIGSGKSEVSRILAELGACILNADHVANQITQTDSDVIQQIKLHFGEHIYTSEGYLKRKELGRLVFSNPDARRRLNQIVHPKMIEKIRAMIRHHQASRPRQLIVVEMAILFETGVEKDFDLVVVVSTSVETVIERLQQRDGLPQTEILQRIQSQLPQAEKEKRADIIIHNNGNLEALRDQIVKLYQAIVQNKLNSYQPKVHP